MSNDHSGAEEVSLVGGRSVVSRRGDVVFRRSQPWSGSTIALLRHLEQEHFEHAPRVIGKGFDEDGRETLTFIEGESVHPYAWENEALPVIGEMLRKLHTATTSFTPPANTPWRPWFGRELCNPSVSGRGSALGHHLAHAQRCLARSAQQDAQKHHRDLRAPINLRDWRSSSPHRPCVQSCASAPIPT